MRVLVTGANGHIGANLVRDLLAHDYDVVPSNVQREIMAEYQPHPEDH